MMKKEAKPAEENGKTEEKTFCLITHASAIAQIALSMVQFERDETKNLLADATKRLPEAHELFSRSLKIVRRPPKRRFDTPLKEFYSYEELCSGGANEIVIGGWKWHPYAEKGDAFFDLLGKYSLSSIETELDKVRGTLTRCLCTMEAQLPQLGDWVYEVDPRFFEIPDILNNIDASELRISSQDTDDLLSIVDLALSNGEERTPEWAHQKLKEWSEKIARRRANDWLLQSRTSGLSSLIVTKLAEYRKKMQLAKGHKPKGISKVSPVP